MHNSGKILAVLGWREWMALPQLGIRLIKAKVDTGARSSCLHAVDIEEYRKRGSDWVKFRIRIAPGRWRTLRQPVVDRREVRDSGGHRTMRPFIRTVLRLAGSEWPIELNLATRTDMLFAMLLGRTAISGRFLVDATRSYVCGDYENTPQLDLPLPAPVCVMQEPRR